MNFVKFEYFLEDGLSKIANNGDSYAKDMLVAHLFFFDGVASPVHKASHICFSYTNYEGNFYYDDVAHPFMLDISSSYGFTFKMDTPFAFTLDPSVYSLIVPSSGGGTSSGTVDLTPLMSELSTIKENLSHMTAFNFPSLNGGGGSFPDGTSVKVEGRDGLYKIKSSQHFFNDSQSSQNMIIYLLERTDVDGVTPIMLSADIYVKKAS